MVFSYPIDDKYSSILSSTDNIFHFTKSKGAIEGILKSETLKLNIFCNTNDPKEYKEKLTGIVGWGIGEEKLRDALDVKAGIDQILLHRSAFISFCQNRYKNSNIVSNACLKSRMWSQYGESHNGMCIIFSKRELNSEMKLVFDKEKYLYFSGKVKYVKMPNDDTTFLRIDRGELDSISKSELAYSFIKSKIKDILFCKLEDYRDEDEYRIIVIGKEDSIEKCTFLDIPIRSSIKGIILGDKFDSVYYPTVFRLAKYLNIELLKLHWEKMEYYIYPINEQD